MRPFWILAAGLLLTALLVAFLIDSGEAPPAVQSPGNMPVSDTQGDLPRVEPETPEAPLRAETQREHAQVAPDKSSSRPGSNGEARLIRGRVSVLNDRGDRHDSEDGTLTVIHWVGDQQKSAQVRITEGTFSVEVPEDADSLTLEDIELSNRKAILPSTEPERIPVLGTDEVSVLVHWLPNISLRVRDDDTGADLQGLTVLRVLDFNRRREKHPGSYSEDEVVGAQLSSPLTLAGGMRTSTCFALAPGYAWGRIEVHEDDPPDREYQIFLKRGGSLELRILSNDRPDGLRIRLRNDDNRHPAVEVRARDEETVAITGIPPGPWIVRGEVGNWWDSPIELGETPVQITAGAITQATLEVGPAPTVKRARLAGVVALPSQWDLDSFRLSIELQDTVLAGSSKHRSIRSSDMTRNGDEFRFDAGEVQVGMYELSIDSLLYTTLRSIGPLGDEHVRIDVPLPGDVFVRLIENATGEDLHSGEVNWHCVYPDGVNGGSLGSATWDSNAQRFAFRAPIGEVVIQVWQDDYEFQEQRVQVHPGTNAVSMRLDRSCGVILRLFDGENLMAWPPGTSPTAEPVTGSGSTVSTSWMEREIHVGVSEPGTYRIQLGQEFPGFEPVEPPEVTIPRGEFPEVKVVLKRRG